MEVTVADQVSKVQKSNFAAAWSEMKASNGAHLEEDFSLTQVKTIEGPFSFTLTYNCSITWIEP